MASAATAFTTHSYLPFGSEPPRRFCNFIISPKAADVNLLWRCFFWQTMLEGDEGKHRRTWRGNSQNPQTSEEQKVVSSPQRSRIKTSSPFSIYSISRGDKYVNLLWHRRRMFFFDGRILLLYAPNYLRSLSPWCVGIRDGVEGGEAPPSKTTTEDDVIRCQLPPPCGCFCALSLLYDSHQKMQPLGQGSETTVSPKPSREAPGSEEGVSPFLLRENPRECTGLLSKTTLNDVLLSGWGMSSLIEDVIDFFVSPYKPLSYIPLRGLVVYRRTTVVIESI